MEHETTVEKGRRAQKREDLRHRIIDMFIELIAQEGIEVSHDLIADRLDVARRTVYRYFPDRNSLMSASWKRISSMIGPTIKFPKREKDLKDSLVDIYQGFDNIAGLATLIATTPQGRAIRLSEKKRRVQSYTDALADTVHKLPAEDAKLATAMLQALHTTLWLELRDQWELDGTQMAKVCRWAITTLLADLRERDGRPLNEEPAARVDPDEPLPGTQKPRRRRSLTRSRGAKAG